MSSLLEARGIGKHFGGLIAVADVDLDVYEGEVLGVIGPNGAGKTTFVNVMSGELAASTGTTVFAGTDVTWLPPHERAALGLVRTFQGVRLFVHQTVRENVEVGSYRHGHSALLGAIRRSRRAREDEYALRANAEKALDVVGLLARADTVAGSLSTGEQRLVGFARALAAEPRLLMLDEPAAGLDDTETDALARSIRDLPGRGATVVVIEHHMGLVMSVCDRVAVINQGRLLAVGSPDEIRANEDVVTAYLGARR